MPCVSTSQSMVGPDALQMASTNSRSTSPRAFSMMSEVSISTESSTPCYACIRVPQAGIIPDDKPVLPLGILSLSRTIGAMPASASESAATKPAAPAPTMATGTEISNSTPSDSRIDIQYFFHYLRKRNRPTIPCEQIPKSLVFISIHQNSIVVTIVTYLYQ